MNQLRYGSAFGVLTGCLVLLGACGALDDGQQGSEATSTSVSEVLVQSCPGYGSCATWSDWSDIGSPYCTSSDQCGDVCLPRQGAPSYCATQIVPTPECCDFESVGQTVTTIQRYQWCWNLAGAMCEQLDQQQRVISCGC